MIRKIYLIAGEPSGDLHGAHLVQALKKENPEILFRGFGGMKMERAGVELDQTIDRLSFMGFSEVVKHLPQIFANLRLAKAAIRTWQPDAIIYIDFPGFNMRVARWAKKQGLRNFYYIAPQAWAWKEKRALQLKRDIDELFCILPFEKSFFARFDYDVHYVGHPLVDIIHEFKESHYVEREPQIQVRNLTKSNEKESTETQYGYRKIIALLPGSRQQEVRKILPVQLAAVRDMEDFHIVIGKSPNIPQTVYDEILNEAGVSTVFFEENTYHLLSKAYVACVASGTATLETALFKVPEVVCFKGSPISYSIAKRLIKVPYISLVNLVMNKEVVKELIQQELTPYRLQDEVRRLIEPLKRNHILQDFSELENRLGLGGAAEKTAKIIISKIGL